MSYELMGRKQQSREKELNLLNEMKWNSINSSGSLALWLLAVAALQQINKVGYRPEASLPHQQQTS